MEWFRETFTLDKRSLALFRVGVAFTMLWDWSDRCANLTLHYTDEGIFTRSRLSLFQLQPSIGFPFLYGSVLSVRVLFGIHLVVLLSLLLGFYTRTATFLSWLFCCTINQRAPILAASGDLLEKAMLLYCCFLPLGEYFSLDSIVLDRKLKTTTVFNPACIAIVVQIMMEYFSASSHKTGPAWLEGSAVWYALQIDYLRTWFGSLLLGFPALCWLLTHLTTLWQRWATILLLLPFRRGLLRTVAALGFSCMHFGFGSGLDLGHFWYITICSSWVLIPSYFWEQLLPKVLPLTALSLEAADDCVGCHFFVGVVSSFLCLPVKNQSRHSVCIHTENLSLDLRESKETDDGFGPVVGLSRACLEARPFRLFFSFLPTSWRRVIAKFCASTAYRLFSWLHGPDHVQSGHPAHDQPLRASVRLALVVWGLLPLYFMTLTVSWTCLGLGYHHCASSSSMQYWTVFYGLEQSWGVFAPEPPRESWLLSVPGLLHSGKAVELLEGGAFRRGELNRWYQDESVRKPIDLDIGGVRWFNFFQALVSHSRSRELCWWFSKHLCVTYKKRFPEDPLKVIQISMFPKYSFDNNNTVAYGNETVIWTYICGEVA